MNILFFTHEKSYGGASRALLTLIKNLRSEHNIYVVVPFKNALIVDELKKLDVEVISCFYSWWQVPVNISFIYKIMYKVAYLVNFFSFRYLVRKIKKLDIDIIHSNTSVIDIGVKVASKLGIPHVWHFREFTGKHLKFIKGETSSYKFINNSESKIVYISNAIKNFYEENINSELGTLIYDGVSEEFLENKKYVKKKEITFLLVGTLEKNKGQEVAVKAVRELNNRGIRNFKLLLAGGDPTGYSEYLLDLVKNFNISELVEYIGFVSDMKKLRKSVDVELMCAPSEAFGLVTIEAMLAGNLVIGSDSGATSELIKNGVNGFLYELNNESDLADKMENIINNSNLLKSMGNNAKEYALNNFSSKKYSDEINKLYNELLREK